MLAVEKCLEQKRKLLPERFKIDWASLIVGRKLTVFAVVVFEGDFQVQAPQGAYIRRGDVTEGFLRYEFVGLIFGGAYTWRGVYSEFYGICFTYMLHLLGFSVKMFRASPKARSRVLDKWNLTSACWTNTSQSSRTWTGIYPCCSPNFMESVSMPTYPSPKPTLPLTSHLEQNVGLRGGVGGQFPRNV